MFLNKSRSIPRRKGSSKSTTSRSPLTISGPKPIVERSNSEPPTQNIEPQTQTFQSPTPNLSEKGLPSLPDISSPVPTSFTQSEHSEFDHSLDMDDDHLPELRYTAYGGQPIRASSIYPGDTFQDFDDKDRKAGRGDPVVGRALWEHLNTSPYHTNEKLFEAPVIPPPFEQAAPSSEKLRKSPNQDGPYHIKEEYDDVPFTRPALEQAAPPSRKLTKSPNQDGPKRKPKWYWAISILAALIVIIVATLAGLGSGGYFSADKQDKATTESEMFSASSTPLLTESPASERVTNAAIPSENVPTSVVVVASSIETSETPSSTPTPTPTPTPTSTLESSSVQSSSSLSSPSPQSSNFMQSTAVLENLVGRSGYLDQRADGSLRYDSLLDLDQGGYLGRREDPEDCEDVTITITTTLTTTFTSTIQTSRMVASSAGSDSASPQPPESEPAVTVPKCITNTIFHTDGLPTSTNSLNDSDTPSMEFSSVTADSTPSLDTTPPPTETSATLSAGGETGVVSTSSVAQARRLANPWNSLQHLRRFLPLFPGNEQNRHLLPSLTIMPAATTRNNDADNSYSVKVLGTTSSNAAVRREAQHWNFMAKSNPAPPSRIHERREVPAQPPSPSGLEVLKTYWKASWELRLLFIQLCYSLKTEAPPTHGDLKMGETLNKTICDSFEQDFPAIDEGAKCDHKDYFHRLLDKTTVMCASAKEGEKYVQSLNLLCNVKNSMEGSIEQCDGDDDQMASQGGEGGSSLLPATSGSPIIDSTAKSPTDIGLTGSESSSILLQANAVTNVDSISGFATTSNIPISNAPSTLSPSTGTGILGTTTIMSATQPPLPSNTMSQPQPNSCPADIPTISYPFKAAWSTPVITSFPDPPTISTWGPVSARLTGHSLGLSVPIPCGYTSSFVDDSSVPNIVVPKTSQIGEISFYNGNDAYINPPACQNGMLMHGEVIAAIGWQLYDWGRGGSPGQKENALCGRKIIASCAGNGEVGFDRKEVELWVRDRCAACRPMDLDVLDDVFKFCAHKDVGTAAVTWRWAEDGESVSPTAG